MIKKIWERPLAHAIGAASSAAAEVSGQQEG